jgi:YesN/AraC family two-component response regulator
MKKFAKRCKNIKLLYVEDDETARDSTLKLLLNFFEHITVAIDGKDGFEKFQNGEFDFILTHISMPKMSGIEMIEKIREQNSQIPIVLLSAYNDSDKFMQAIELDIDGYVLKPIVYDKIFLSLKKNFKKI